MKKVRFIIRARDDGGTVAEVLTMIQNDPALELVDTIGPADKPHTAVVAVDPEQAPSFEQRFRNQQHLMIEPDRPLSLSDTAADLPARSERNTNA
jgi:hypothetical protein